MLLGALLCRRTEVEWSRQDGFVVELAQCNRERPAMSNLMSGPKWLGPESLVCSYWRNQSGRQHVFPGGVCANTMMLSGQPPGNLEK